MGNSPRADLLDPKPRAGYSLTDTPRIDQEFSYETHIEFNYKTALPHHFLLSNYVLNLNIHHTFSIILKKYLRVRLHPARGLYRRTVLKSDGHTMAYIHLTRQGITVTCIRQCKGIPCTITDANHHILQTTATLSPAIVSMAT